MSESALWMWLVGAIVVGGAISAALAGQAGATLQGKFESLGDMTGKTRDQIVEVVGPPNAESVVGDDLILLQWQATGYHIAIQFQGELFAGITHQAVADAG